VLTRSRTSGAIPSSARAASRAPASAW
jgi:hypothetical protein